MDLDPMKRKIVTRCIGIFDMVLGCSVLIFNLHTMWDYYLHDVRKASQGVFMIEGQEVNVTGVNQEELDKMSEQLRQMQLPFYSFVMLCVVVFALNLFQIFMGFALQVATFGRNQVASIHIARCWLRGSMTLLFLVVLKTIVLGTAFLCEEMPADWVTFGLGVIEIVFRIFGCYWIPKFIIFLKFQSEFDSRCYVLR